jgi:hypothetical protein
MESRGRPGTKRPVQRTTARMLFGDIQQSTDDFRAQEPIMLNALRPGTKIRFAADRLNGELVITKILTD